jgi:hypothetical protein
MIDGYRWYTSSRPLYFYQKDSIAEVCLFYSLAFAPPVSLSANAQRDSEIWYIETLGQHATVVSISRGYLGSPLRIQILSE